MEFMFVAKALSQTRTWRNIKRTTVLNSAVAMHSFVVSLLLSVTLTCPYECALKLATARAGKLTAKVCCENCQTRTNAAHEGAPTQGDMPSSDEDGWCMCEGAVFDVSSQRLLDDAVALYSEFGFAGESLLPELLRQDWSLNASDFPPSHDGGQLVRILNQSFLL